MKKTESAYETSSMEEILHEGASVFLAKTKAQYKRAGIRKLNEAHYQDIVLSAFITGGHMVSQLLKDAVDFANEEIGSVKVKTPGDPVQ